MTVSPAVDRARATSRERRQVPPERSTQRPPGASILAILLVILGVAGITACSLQLEVLLLNNSGKIFAVHLKRGDIPIGVRASAKFYYPGPDDGWMLRLSTPQCEYTFEVPSSLDHFPWHEKQYADPIKVQVEPDFSLFLLPPSATGLSPVDQFAAFQRDGFPLRPVSASCHADQIK